MTSMARNFGAAADDYARFRAGFPDSFFERVGGFGIGLPGQRIVDLGTGSGTLARGFAARGSRVIGIDPDARMLEQARRLARDAGLVVDFREGTAERTGLAGDSCDVVSAGQCWHWFDRDAAAAEAARMLCADGRLLLAHFDWLPLPGSVVEATERLIEAHNPRWKLGGGIGMHPHNMPGLQSAGFCALETFSYDVYAPYTPEGWRGRIRASAGVGGSLDAEGVAAFDRALAELLEERFPEPLLAVPHRVFAIVARAPARG